MISKKMPHGAGGLPEAIDNNSQSNNSISKAIVAAGLGAPYIIPDGKIHRFTAPDDRPGSNNCWYLSHQTAGAFGSWKLGFTQTWHNGKSENNAELLKEIREYQRHRAADMEILRNDAAIEAHNLWLSASREIDHQYPTRKKITPCGSRQTGNLLLVPMYYRGKLANLQRIYPDGKKRFMKGGRVTGCYLPLGKLDDHILIAEGWATACSLYQHTDSPIATAFNAGNLKPVALSIREKYPRIKITVCCDNDHETEVRTGTNVGIEKGRAAAAAVGGDYIWPVFDHVEDATGLSDFNDYLNTGGEQ